MKYIAADKVVPLCRLLMFGVPQKTADTMCEDIQALVDQQAVDAAPVVHANWIPSADYKRACSHCGCPASLWEFNKYCPNCGAKMNMNS